MMIHDSWHEGGAVRSPVPNYDLMLFCGSFESRCHALAELLKCEVGEVHVLMTRDPDDQMPFETMQEARLIETLERHHRPPQAHRVFLDGPVKTWVTLHALLEPAVAAGKNVMIDITVMPREIMGMIVAILGLAFINQGKVTFAYVPAIAYDDDHPWEKVWLSRGVKDVRAVIGYEGRSGSDGTHLIVVNGFELDRAVAIIERLEPAGVSVARTDQSGSTHPKFATVQQGVRQQLERVLPKAASVVDIFPKSCAKTYSSLSKHISSLESDGVSNIAIAPLNTKPSSLAVFLLASERPALQVVYAEPQIYNVHHYSEGQPGYYEITFR